MHICVYIYMYVYLKERKRKLNYIYMYIYKGKIHPFEVYSSIILLYSQYYTIYHWNQY